MEKCFMMIWSAIKRYFKEIGTPYELREREPMTEEQINELRKLLENSFAEKNSNSLGRKVFLLFKEQS
mgnify:CR=1 FL=1